jgi:hypothetical protein
MSDLAYLPDFSGKEIPADRLDGIMAFAFSRGDLDDARSLFSTKWFDYRFIHPGHSLYLFCHYYAEAVERWRSKFGLNTYFRTQQLTNPIWRARAIGSKVEYTLTPNRVRTCWLRAVMFADQYGIPYDRWIEWAFEYAFEFNWEKIPMPGQLYSDKMVSYILKRWEEAKDAMLCVPKDPRFLSENYQGHPWQNECQDFFLKQIVCRANPVIALRNFLINEPVITEARARAALGDHNVDRALSK